jgi:hypothetical protein
MGNSLELVFEGDPGFRPGRFGVRFEVPELEGDSRWNAMGQPTSSEHWARIAAMVEIMVPYEAVSEREIAAADADGVRWLASP